MGQYPSFELTGSQWAEASIDTLNKWLENHDVNERGEWGMTPLMLTCALNASQAVRWLINNGADPNARTVVNQTALNYAVNPQSNIEIVRLLLERGNGYFGVKSENRELVYSAVYMGQYEALVLMEQYGAKIVNEYDKSENLMDIALKCTCGDRHGVVNHLRSKGFNTMQEIKEELRQSDHNKRLKESHFYRLVDSIYLDKKGKTLRGRLLKWGEREVRVDGGPVMTNEAFINDVVLPNADSKEINGYHHRKQYLAHVRGGNSFYAIPKMVYDLLPVTEKHNI